jgi:hypothetical protein
VIYSITLVKGGIDSVPTLLLMAAGYRLRRRWERQTVVIAALIGASKRTRWPSHGALRVAFNKANPMRKYACLGS